MARTAGSDGATTKEAIRAAAVDLISAHGFAAVTLRDLATRVGLQAGSLYRYFPSKNEILLTIMEDHLQDLLDHWEAAKPASADPLERLETFVDFHVRYHARKQDEVFIANMEMRNLIPEHHGIVAGLRDRYELILRTILQDGVDQGQFSVSDVQVATFAILAMLTGLTAWYREGGRLTKEQLVECYVGLIVDGVRGRRGA